MHQYGRILKVYNSVVHVSVDGAEMLCKLRGKSMRGRDALLPGDVVRVVCGTDSEGVIEGAEFYDLTQIVITVAAASPDPHPLVVSRFLVLAEHSGIRNIVLCINKIDLIDGEAAARLCAPYEAAGYPVLPVSAAEGTGIAALRERLSGEITVFAGPSGAGKSSLLNAMDSSLGLAVGAVSEKIGRGRHTTRRAELLPFVGGYVVDTPGFTQQELTGIAADDLANCFPEFLHFPGCRFTPCSHSHEPDCAVKAAAEEGRLACERYDAYIALLKEIRSARK